MSADQYVAMLERLRALDQRRADVERIAKIIADNNSSTVDLVTYRSLQLACAMLEGARLEMA